VYSSKADAVGVVGAWGDESELSLRGVETDVGGGGGEGGAGGRRPRSDLGHADARDRRWAYGGARSDPLRWWHARG